MEPEDEAFHLRETQFHLHHQSLGNRKAAPVRDRFSRQYCPAGGKVLFIGCKKQAQEAVKEAAVACGKYYVNQRWLGGTLTNLATIRKSVARLNISRRSRNLLNTPNGKTGIRALGREAEKLRRNLEGIRTMDGSLMRW